MITLGHRISRRISPSQDAELISAASPFHHMKSHSRVPGVRAWTPLQEALILHATAPLSTCGWLKQQTFSSGGWKSEIKTWFSVRTLAGLQPATCPPFLILGRERTRQRALVSLIGTLPSGLIAPLTHIKVLSPNTTTRGLRIDSTCGFWGHKIQLLTPHPPPVFSLALSLEGLFVSLPRKQELRSFSVLQRP